MTRLVLYTALAFFLLTILGPLLRLVGIESASVDIGAILVLHRALGERRVPYSKEQGWRFLPSGLEGDAVALALILGYLTDLLGGLSGVHGLGLAALYLIARALSRQVSLVGAVSQCLPSFAAAVAVAVIGLFARWATGGHVGAGIAAVLLGQAVLTAAAAPLLLRLLRWIDTKLSRESTERGTLRIGDMT